jgi:hypothetical protein
MIGKRNPFAFRYKNENLLLLSDLDGEIRKKYFISSFNRWQCINSSYNSSKIV